MGGKKAGLPGTSFIVVGPQGCGKTTALASLCQQQEGFPKEEHAARRALAKDMGRPQGGGHTWMLDELRTERERKMTVDTSVAYFQTDAFSYSAIDTPGDAGLTKLMLGVTSLADIAVLVVPGREGDFEEAVDSGRAREIALACFTMGIKNVMVWVTKLDDISVKEPGLRFEEIKKVVNTFLKEVGYKQKDVPVVPVMGLTGENLKSKSSETSWYSGKSVSDSLDAMGPIPRGAEKPLRLPVLKVYESDDAGTVIMGRIETGTMRSGIKLLFSPSAYSGQVASIHKEGDQVSEAKGGDIVTVSLGSSVLASDLRRGMVASFITEDPACDADTFLAQVVVFDKPGAIQSGYCPTIAIHTAHVPCEFEELVSLLDRKTKEEKANPEKAKSGEVVTVRMRPRLPVCVEAFQAYPSLGRFAVRDHGRIIGVGVVKEVKKMPVAKPRFSGTNED